MGDATLTALDPLPEALGSLKPKLDELGTEPQRRRPVDVTARGVPESLALRLAREIENR